MSFQPHSDPNPNADWVDTPHLVLSVKPMAQQSLLEHLQVGLPNPLDLLLAGEEPAQSAMMDQVIVEPAPITLPEGEEPTAPPLAQSVILQQGVPLSQCKLWEMLVNYYASQGINAWRNSVPNFITSSVYMADAYAENILAFLNDYYDQLDLDEPIYIVEMATGAGRFSFHLLRELDRKLACFSRFKSLKLGYIMTDFTRGNVEFWKHHGRFIPFVEAGMLDFAVFNPLEDQSFTLEISGQQVDCQNIKNPVIAIANYFFDSTPVDVFRVEEQTIHAGLVTLERDVTGIDPDTYPHITQITTQFEYKPLPDANYYEDTELNDVLDSYRSHIKKGTILMPVGAFNVVRNLRKLSNNRLVLLSSDKAYTNPNTMIGFEHHEFAIHDGTFSYMVNYDALGLYFSKIGGKCFATGGRHLSVHTVCLISMNEDRDYEHVRYVFREKIDRQNPANSLCAMLPGREKAELNNDRLNYMLAQIRMQMADPFIFAELSKPLTLAASHAWTAQRAELLRLLDLALENYYYYPGEGNLPFQLAPIYHMLGCHEQSLYCLSISHQLFGVSALHHFLVGQALEPLNRQPEALAAYERALQMQPDFPEAERALNELIARRDASSCA